MKMNLGKRLVLFAHWVLSILVCLLAFLQLDFWRMPQADKDVISALLVSALVLCAFSIVAVALWVFRRPEKKADRGFITVGSSEAGRTRIAVSAVEQMIRQAVRGVDGIMEMKTAITDTGEAIDVDVNLSLQKGTHVPTAGAQMQSAIRGYIEQNCGVAVREVRIDVRFVETDAEKTRRGLRKKDKGAVEAAPVVPVEAPVAEEPAVDEPMAEEPGLEAGVPELELCDGGESAEADLEAADGLDDEIVLTLHPQLDPIEEPAGEEEPKEE